MIKRLRDALAVTTGAPSAGYRVRVVTSGWLEELIE
jgi:hypothetical protein